MITLARSSDAKTKLHRIRRAVSFLQDKDAVRKLFEVIGPRFANRAGGYIRILRLPDYRIGDGGTKVVFELVENNILEQQMKAAEANAAKSPAEAEGAGTS
jgi:large subunit ribosomal protein L17